mmetsp:Transcript_36992/g.104419  ORF Transcript_36992/g.104419 Transcript_36992/m.104419 type:complete len:690 (+) Transcript_36992:257-2326(+)
MATTETAKEAAAAPAAAPEEQPHNAAADPVPGQNPTGFGVLERRRQQRKRSRHQDTLGIEHLVRAKEQRLATGPRDTTTTGTCGNPPPAAEGDDVVVLPDRGNTDPPPAAALPTPAAGAEDNGVDAGHPACESGSGSGCRSSQEARNRAATALDTRHPAYGGSSTIGGTVGDESSGVQAEDGSDIKEEPHVPDKAPKVEAEEDGADRASADNTCNNNPLAEEAPQGTGPMDERQLWTKVEDEQLRRLMHQVGAEKMYSNNRYLPEGEVDWASISTQLNKDLKKASKGDKLTKKQVKDRWEQHLRPGLLKHKSLTKETRHKILHFLEARIGRHIHQANGRQSVKWMKLATELWEEGIRCSASTVKNLWNSNRQRIERRDRIVATREQWSRENHAQPSPVMAQLQGLVHTTATPSLHPKDFGDEPAYEQRSLLKGEWEQQEGEKLSPRPRSQARRAPPYYNMQPHYDWHGYTTPTMDQLASDASLRHRMDWTLKSSSDSHSAGRTGSVVSTDPGPQGLQYCPSMMASYRQAAAASRHKPQHPQLQQPERLTSAERFSTPEQVFMFPSGGNPSQSSWTPSTAPSRPVSTYGALPRELLGGGMERASSSGRSSLSNSHAWHDFQGDASNQGKDAHWHPPALFPAHGLGVPAETNNRAQMSDPWRGMGGPPAGADFRHGYGQFPGGSRWPPEYR